MDNERLKKLKIVIAVVLCIMMAVTAILPVLITSGVGAVSQKDIDALNQKLSNLGSDRKKIEAEIKDIKDDRALEIAKKRKLDSEISIIEQQIDTLNELIDMLDSDIAQRTLQLNEAQEKSNKQYENLMIRIRATYEAGSTSYLELLLTSDSYANFLTNMDIVSNIVSYDKKLLEELQKTVSEIDEAKIALEQSRTLQLSAKSELEAGRADLRKKVEQAQQMISTLAAQEKSLATQNDDIEKAEQDLRNEIDKMIKELSKAQYVGGTFLWPVPEYTKITSYYGPRTHPVTGKVNSFHSGVDLAAAYGKNVLAANSGTIIISGYNSVYGEYIVIDHGGGYSTMYGHMSKRAVSQNKAVKKGDVIGYIGSTGLSTGNHLHFEIRVNGSSEDPMGHFKKS